MGSEDLPIKKVDVKKEKHRILKELQGVSPLPDTLWTLDGIHEIGGYDSTFTSLLNHFGFETFQELVDKTAQEKKKKLQVLDLFGGAYFLEDLTSVAKIIGARLGNIDDELIKMYEIVHDEERRAFLKKLLSSEQREVIAGNLYKKEPWNQIQNKGVSGFDLIVCRPVGHFIAGVEKVKDDTGVLREEIFITLLNRATSLLSPGGVLFTEIPELHTSQEVWNLFLENYVPKKESEGYQFIIEEGRNAQGVRVLAVRKDNK